MHTRPCPLCGQTLTHTRKSNRDIAAINKRPCRSCSAKICNSGERNPFFGKRHSQETKDKLAAVDRSYLQDPVRRKKHSEDMAGDKNPMYGRCNYEVWCDKYGEEEARQRQDAVKKVLSEKFSGKLNPMYGKPSPQGSGNGWSGWYKGWFFRSLRELAYVVKCLEATGRTWRTAERADLQVEYINWQGTKRTYRADFLVDEKYLVEVKPARLHSSRTIRDKAEAAEEFCQNKGLQYMLEDPPILTDQEIAALREKGLIRFTDRYEQMFTEKYSCGK